MAKINAPKNCGNAPKQGYILEFLTAMANFQIETVLDMLTDDAQIEIIGRGTYKGKGEIEELLRNDAGRSRVATLDVSTIISHGKQCAASGVMHFDDGGEVAFNNMYTFSGHGKNAKLQQVETYSLMLD